LAQDQPRLNRLLVRQALALRAASAIADERGLGV